MSLKLVVWDFDGTLVDSLLSSLGIFNRLAEELRYRPIEDPQAVRSMSTRQFLRHHGISVWRLPRLVRRFHAAAAEEAEHLRLFPGLTTELESIRACGVRQGILSSNKEDNIRRSLRVNYAEGLFDFVIGYPRLFGKAKALRRILRSEELERRDVLYVGDEVRDIEAAHKAGVPSVAVTWGFQAEALLRDCRPDHLVSSPVQLRDVMRSTRTNRTTAAG